MLQGSSAELSVSLNLRENLDVQSCWYKITRTVEEEVDSMVKVVEMNRRYTFGEHVPISQANSKHQHMLIIDDVKKNDSGHYMYQCYTCETCENSDLPGVMLVVTGNTLACLLCIQSS